MFHARDNSLAQGEEHTRFSKKSKSRCHASGCRSHSRDFAIALKAQPYPHQAPWTQRATQSTYKPATRSRKHHNRSHSPHRHPMTCQLHARAESTFCPSVLRSAPEAKAPSKRKRGRRIVDAAPLNRWAQRGSNPRPSVPETDALSTELRTQNHAARLMRRATPLLYTTPTPRAPATRKVPSARHIAAREQPRRRPRLRRPPARHLPRSPRPDRPKHNSAVRAA